jgi:hypothetical protein
VSRRQLAPRDSGGFGRKVLTWLAVAGLIYWAGRDPAWAAAVFHGIGQAFANMAHHAGHASGGRP